MILQVRPEGKDREGLRVDGERSPTVRGGEATSRGAAAVRLPSMMSRGATAAGARRTASRSTLQPRRCQAVLHPSARQLRASDHLDGGCDVYSGERTERRNGQNPAPVLGFSFFKPAGAAGLEPATPRFWRPTPCRMVERNPHGRAKRVVIEPHRCAWRASQRPRRDDDARDRTHLNFSCSKAAGVLGSRRGNPYVSRPRIAGTTEMNHRGLPLVSGAGRSPRQAWWRTPVPGLTSVSDFAAHQRQSVLVKKHHVSGGKPPDLRG